MTEYRTCAYCGGLFATNRGDKRFCSANCRKYYNDHKRSDHAPNGRVCPCGQSFVVTSKHPNKRYCSPACKIKYSKRAIRLSRLATGTYQPILRSAAEDFLRYAEMSLDPATREFCLDCADRARR